MPFNGVPMTNLISQHEPKALYRIVLIGGPLDGACWTSLVVPEHELDVALGPATLGDIGEASIVPRRAHYRWKSSRLIDVYGFPVLAFRYEYVPASTMRTRIKLWQRAVQAFRRYWQRRTSKAPRDQRRRSREPMRFSP